MNFLQLCQTLSQEAGVSGAGPGNVTNQTGMNLRMVNWVREAWDDIQAQCPHWSFLAVVATVTLPAGVRALPLSAIGANIRTVRQIGIIDGAQISPLVHDVHATRLTFANSAGTGRPSRWRLSDDRRSVEFDMAPEVATVLDVEAYRAPQSLQLATNEPLAPEYLHRVIIYRALQMYALFDEAQTLLAKANDGYGQWLARLYNECAPVMDFAESPYP